MTTDKTYGSGVAYADTRQTRDLLKRIAELEAEVVLLQEDLGKKSDSLTYWHNGCDEQALQIAGLEARVERLRAGLREVMSGTAEELRDDARLRAEGDEEIASDPMAYSETASIYRRWAAENRGIEALWSAIIEHGDLGGERGSECSLTN